MFIGNDLRAHDAHDVRARVPLNEGRRCSSAMTWEASQVAIMVDPAQRRPTVFIGNDFTGWRRDDTHARNSLNEGRRCSSAMTIIIIDCYVPRRPRSTKADGVHRQ